MQEEFRKNDQQTKVTVIVGDKDQYLTGEVLNYESARIEELFSGKAKTIIFEGGHINKLV